MEDQSNSKKRKRIDDQDDQDDVLEEFGKKTAPPPALILPGGYSDESNPFGDTQLSMPFRWKLKNQKLAKSGVNVDLSKEEEERQREATFREIEQLRQRRFEREAEEAAWEKEQARIAREKEQLSSIGWEKDEDRFLLSQLKMLALKRLQELRPHSIDLLYLIYSAYLRIWLKQLKLTQDPPKSSVEQQLQQMESTLVLPRNLPSPQSILNDIDNLNDIKLLTDDIQLFYAVESDPKSSMNKKIEEIRQTGEQNVNSASSYWSALQVLVDEKESQILLKSGTDASNAIKSQDVILPEVLESIDALLEDKDINELRELEKQVNMTLESGVPIDEEYWRSLLKRLKLFKARAHVNQIFQVVLKDLRDNPNANSKNIPEKVPVSSKPVVAEPATFDEDGFEEYDEDEGVTDRGALSMDTSNIFADQAPSLYSKVDDIPDEETLMREERAKGFGKGEEIFGEEDTDANLKQEIRKALQGFNYGDKYRPRKPKYFNRVKTGYEWTKYNRIHYDHDNPPPKVVQGYKFTIFYPDLIDPTKPPQFSIEKTESPDFVILRFRAGPPYLDIAFRIVNKEWSVAPKHGYKCLFARGVLYLWFNFKRLRYRR